MEWAGLTLRGQAARVPRAGGETESRRERFRRAGHHADPVDVPRRELAPPRRAPEVLVIALGDTTRLLVVNGEWTAFIRRPF